jgi:hypothetical protein
MRDREARRVVLRTLAASAGLAALATRIRPVRAASPSGSSALAPFSSAGVGGGLPAPWAEQSLRNVAANRHSIVDDAGDAVLQIESATSASSVLHPVDAASSRATRLRWRWKTSGYPSAKPLGEKRGDDYAARVYVMYDYPIDRVPVGQRLLLRVGRALYGEQLPAATLCYLLDPRAPSGTLLDSPYSSRVKMLVVRSSRETGRWWSEERDLHADFARAFGAEHGPGTAPIRAIAVAGDTDQSESRVVARFGDLLLI